MKDEALYQLKIKVDENDIRTMDLTEEQGFFYSGKFQNNCSRSHFFDALAKVYKSRPQAEIDFLENIVLLTKNEFYEVSIEAIPVMMAFNQNDIYKDGSVIPERNRPLVVICYDNTIVSPVRYCGEHFHTIGNSGIRPKTIYKWAYQDQFFNQLGIEAIDPALAKEIDEQITAEKNAKSKTTATTIFEVIVEVLNDISNEKPKRPYH